MALAEAELCVWVRAAQHGRMAARRPRNGEPEALCVAKHGVCVGGCEFTLGAIPDRVGPCGSERQFSHAEGQMVAAQLIWWVQKGHGEMDGLA